MDELARELEGIGWVKPVLILAILFFAGVLVRLIRFFSRRLYLRRILRLMPGGAADHERERRQQTVITLFDSMVRYVVYGAAVVVIVGLLFSGAPGALFSASLLIVVTGFTLQRLLSDVVSGVLLLFEGHFVVGDFVTVHTVNVSGIVDEFTLRTTTLRSLDGRRHTLLNGQIMAFTKYEGGYRNITLRFCTNSLDAARSAVGVVTSRRADSSGFVREPSLDCTPPAEGDVARCTLRFAVAPTHDEIAEEIAADLERELADALVGGVRASSLDTELFDQYRADLLSRT